MVIAESSLKLSTKEYVSHITSLPSILVAGLTDGSIWSVPINCMSEASPTIDDASMVSRPANDTKIVGLTTLPSSPMSVISCDDTGNLKIWDMRAKNGLQQQTKALDSHLKATTMGVSNFGEVAVGTEAAPDAEIWIYDFRQIYSAKPLVKYTDSHNDDITDLQFHPSRKNRMVSGSTDGIVNLFDISIQDEDEAVLEAYNHQASIHRAGFLSDEHEAVRRLRLADNKTSQDRVFALSHMETLTVYPVNLEVTDDSSTNVEGSTIGYGDLRDAWNCQYVADYQKQHFLIGSNDDSWACLVPIVDGKPQSRVMLEGGHGEEVVRCFDIWQPSGACITGGEDGTVKLWDITGNFEESAQLTSSLMAQEKNQNKTGKTSSKILKRCDPLERKNNTKHIK